MKKIFLALTCMAGLTMMMACGGGNASSNNSETESNEATEQEAIGQAPVDDFLAGTTWTAREEYDDDDNISYIVYEITFTKDGKSTWTMTAYDKSGNVDSSMSDKLSGTYTFEDERGTLDYGKRVDPGEMYITADGSLFVNVRYESHSFTKVN